MNPLLGVFYHWLGGLAAGSFYVPYRAVRRWSWETYWLVGGVFSWILAPITFAYFMTKDVFHVFAQTPPYTLGWTYFFGVLWGIGGLTFGLTMRYLGMSLGMAVALGYCAAFGTLIPPIFRGEFAARILGTASGRWVLFGVFVCLVGIAISGLAGMSQEREMPGDEKRRAVKEFDFRKGLVVATISGVLSACFSFGLAAGEPIKLISELAGTAPLWHGLPVLVIVMLGGFTTNFLWCSWLHSRNGTGYQYFSGVTRGEYPERTEETIIETALEAPSEEMIARHPAPDEGGERVPLLANYFFSALAGVIWYFQFFFYSMGESQMGRYGFSSWTLHMASIIIFSTLWGIALHEWRGSSPRTRRLVGLGLIVLVASTIIVGYGNSLNVTP